jgi:hypothetical protein
MYDAIKCGGDQPGGQIDVYRRFSGYYSKCIQQKTEDGTVVWNRTEESLTAPDFRMGFPWTVKDWDKFWGNKPKSSMKMKIDLQK